MLTLITMCSQCCFNQTNICELLFMSDDQTVDELEDSLSEADSLRSDDPIRRLIEGPPVDEAEYDTDLEEEFAPGKSKVHMFFFRWPVGINSGNCMLCA